MGTGQGKQGAEGSRVYGVWGMREAEAAEVCVCGVGGRKMTNGILAINGKVEYNNIHTNHERGMDMSFTFNVHGQLQSFNLPEYKALWPLFETVVNSIQSIEDSENKHTGKIFIKAERENIRQGNLDGTSNEAPFISFWVKDNGTGFDEKNYKSFCEAYSTLKLEKGCKGIGRFLWLKAFNNVHILSKFKENDKWFKREFDFSAKDEIFPEENISQIFDDCQFSTEVKLENCLEKYTKKIPLSIEALGKKIIEHCLLYFLSDHCPEIILVDSDGGEINLNDIFDGKIKESLHRDEMNIKGKKFIIYHIRMKEGNAHHELHLCANSREVQLIRLSKYIPDLQGKITCKAEKEAFYYQGYIISEYLNNNVNLNRTSFEFENSLYDERYIYQEEIVEASKHFIELYLQDDLEDVKKKKMKRINDYVNKVKPQYKYLLKNKPEVYNIISAGVKDNTSLEMALHKESQKWELELVQQATEIEDKVKHGEFTAQDFNKIFNGYCNSITEISKASLAEYVIRRKSILDLLEHALEQKDDGSYFSEATIHSIICPMQHTSDDIEFEEMNLWVIDDRLSYHTFLASDKKFRSLPTINVQSDERMDLAVFDQAISFSDSSDGLNSISIIEFKKACRDDLKKDDKNPINQVLRYVKAIRDGEVKKANGRPFGSVSNTAFFCYVIADLTDSMIMDAENAGLILSADGEGYFGYNESRKAYIEVISYNKLIRDAKQRNSILFDKLFSPNVTETLNGKLLNSTDAINRNRSII